jgi:hypothetical protein
MTNIRNHNNNNTENKSGENNQDVNPPPTHKHVLAMQAQMLQTMQYQHANCSTSSAATTAEG